MAVKHLNMAGVRVFAYLTDSEIRLDSPIDALIMQVQAFGAAIERQKAGQRTYDALVRKAKSGHVTGGQCFGYDNLRINGHVERRINEQEAAVIRRIFELCAAGHGQIAIAHRLNEERAIAPRAQQGRPVAWASSTVREVLRRPLYRRLIVYNRSKKRNAWGQVKTQRRPESEWISHPGPRAPHCLGNVVEGGACPAGDDPPELPSGHRGGTWPGGPATGARRSTC